jgi:MarR family transcriptional regulator for hemolysin
MSGSGDRSSLGYELGYAARRWRARADQRLARFGLSHAKWAPLRHLSRTGGSLPQYQLAEQVNVEGPSLVRVLDELERHGLIKRCDSDADRRSKIVRLTDKAGAMVNEIGVCLEQLRDEVLDGVPDKDIATFRRVLARIMQNLQKVEP